MPPPTTGITSMTMAGKKLEPDPDSLPVNRYLNPADVPPPGPGRTMSASPE